MKGEEEEEKSVEGSTDSGSLSRTREWVWGKHWTVAGRAGGEYEKEERVTEKESVDEKSTVSGNSYQRRGRPTKAESLLRERRQSTSSVSSVLDSFERWKAKRAREESQAEKETQRNTKKKKEIAKIIKMSDVKVEDLENIIRKVIGEENDKFRKKWKEDNEKFKEELKENFRKMKEEFEEKEKKWKEENEELKRRINQMERREKKANIVIRGVGNKEDSALKIAKEVVRNTGGGEVESEIVDAFNIGRGGAKVILVKMSSYDSKREVMKNRSKLKGSRIYVDARDDLTSEDDKIQRNIRKWAKAESAKGKRVNVRTGKCLVDGTMYEWDEERQEMSKGFQGGQGGRGREDRDENMDE